LKETIMPELRFSELSGPRQILIRQCQRMGFGKILRLDIHDCEPVFGAGTEVLLDVKLDSAETRRHEQDLADFVLCAAVSRFLEHLDSIRDGSVEQIDVRAGVPVRMIFKASANL
jgi:hypothetical protein